MKPLSDMCHGLFVAELFPINKLNCSSFHSFGHRTDEIHQSLYHRHSQMVLIKKKKPTPELVVHIVRVTKYHHKAIIILQRAWWLNILKCKCQEHTVSTMLLMGTHVLCWVVFCSAWWSCFCLL